MRFNWLAFGFFYLFVPGAMLVLTIKIALKLWRVWRGNADLKITLKHASHGAHGAYVKLNDSEGVKVFKFHGSMTAKQCRQGNEFKVCQKEFDTMILAYEKLGDDMPKPIKTVVVKIRGRYYPGLVMTHIPGRTYESLDYGKKHDLSRERIPDFWQNAMVKGVYFHDRHSENLMYCERLDKLFYIDFSPQYVDVSGESTDDVLDRIAMDMNNLYKVG